MFTIWINFFHSRVTQLVIFSANVAIPISLIKKKDGGDVMFIVYIRVDEAYLSKDDLEYAIMVSYSKKQFCHHSLL